MIVPSGVGAGEPFRLRPWQQKFIRDVYEPTDKDGLRLVQQAILSMARKNGKTALIAALGLVHLVGPESIENGEVYSAANERDQAALVFKFAAQMVRADEELSAVLRVVDSTKTIACYRNGSFYRAISAEAGTKHGLNPSFVVYDELAQAKKRDLYDVLDTSAGARTEPLFIVISTQSNDPEHVLSKLIDDGLSGDDPTTVAHLYAVPDEVEDVFDESVWPLANPALGDFRLMAEMRRKAERAARMPSFESAFRNLYLNQRVDAQSPLIPRSEWMACLNADNRLKLGERVYLGLDLSATTDLLALVAVSEDDGDRCQAWFWKPKDLLQDHENRDRAPYTAWAREGYIDTPPGRAIDYGYVAQSIAGICSDFEVVGLGYDRWRIENLLREFGSIGLDVYVDGRDDARSGAVRLVPWGQGFRDMAPAVDALEVSIIERKFVHDGNPVLTMCFANAVVARDPAGNRKLDKSATRFRIDGAVAAAIAVGLKARDMTQESEPSFWEQVA